MVDATKVFPRNWRYFPSLDPQVLLGENPSCKASFKGHQNGQKQ